MVATPCSDWIARHGGMVSCLRRYGSPWRALARASESETMRAACSSVSPCSALYCSICSSVVFAALVAAAASAVNDVAHLPAATHCRVVSSTSPPLTTLVIVYPPPPLPGPLVFFSSLTLPSVQISHITFFSLKLSCAFATAASPAAFLNSSGSDFLHSASIHLTSSSSHGAGQVAVAANLAWVSAGRRVSASSLHPRRVWRILFAVGLSSTFLAGVCWRWRAAMLARLAAWRSTRESRGSWRASSRRSTTFVPWMQPVISPRQALNAVRTFSTAPVFPVPHHAGAA